MIEAPASLIAMARQHATAAEVALQAAIAQLAELTAVAQVYEAADDVAPVSLDGAAALYRARRMRDRFFDGLCRFGEPGWDMLLDLHAAAHGRRRISVTSVCLASAAPPTTALRYLELLGARGAVQRLDCDEDLRRSYVTLTPAASDAMGRYLAWHHAMQVSA